MGILENAMVFSVINFFIANRIKEVFTPEKLSDDLREVEDLETTVARDAAAAEAQGKVHP